MASPPTEPQAVPQPQPDGTRGHVECLLKHPTAQALDAQVGLAEPLRQLQPTAAQGGESASSLVQSPPMVGERRVNSMEKLPSLPEETPDKRKQREKDEVERKRREQESLEFQQRFDLSPTEPLIEDYSCAHTSTSAIYQGRLYLSKSYMCFYSPLFSKLLRVNLRKLVDIEKRSTLGVFPNGIEVTMENGKKLSFISFIYRDQAYNTLCKLVKELKELGSAPPPTPHGEELPNVVTEEDGQDGTKPRTGSNVRRTLSRSLSTGHAAGLRSSSPFVVEERRGSDAAVRQVSTPTLPTGEEAAAPNGTAPGGPAATSSGSPPSGMDAPKASATTTPTAAAAAVKEAPVMVRDKESVPPAKRPEEPKGGKETIASLLNGTSAPAVTNSAEPTPSTSSSASPPAPSSMAAAESTGRDTPTPAPVPAPTPAPPLAPAAAVPSVVALPLPTPPPTVDPLVSVPVTDKCSHLTPCKNAPVLTQTIPISLSTFFRRVMADGTNTWMLALKDPNADSYFQQSAWSLSKEKCCLQRKLDFQVPYQSPLRSGVTRVAQEHTIRLVKPDYIVIESASQSLDVPYSDSFSVITRIDVESTTIDPASPSCHLALRTEVKWLKSVWMLKSTIETKSIEGNTQFLTHWLEVVKRKATEIDTPEVAPARATPAGSSVTREQKVVDEKPLPYSTEASAAPSAAASSPPPASAPAPAAPPPSPTALRVSTSSSPVPAAAQPASLSSGPFSFSSVLIGVGLLLLLLVFLFLRVSSIEAQVASLRGANEHLSRRLVFLQSFVAALSSNVTGSAGPLKDQLAHWQVYEVFRRQLEQSRELTRTAATMLERMMQQQAEYESTLARTVAEQAAQSADYTAVLFADASESSASWGASLVALLITVVLVFVADLHLLSGAVTFRLLRRRPNGN